MSVDDLSPYEGEWVAVRDGKVVAHAKDEQTLRGNLNVRDSDDMYPVGAPPMGYMVSS